MWSKSDLKQYYILVIWSLTSFIQSLVVQLSPDTVVGTGLSPLKKSRPTG